MASRVVTNPPTPGSDEWLRRVTASKVPAILGVSRFKSQYTLWHEMAGLVDVERMDEDRATWGHVAEKSLAEWWAYKHPGWKLNPKRRGTFEVAYTDAGLPFPNLVTLDRRGFNPAAARADRFRIIECKTAATLADWGRPGEDDSIPTDYYVQTMFQMGVSGIHTTDVVVLGSATRPEIHRVEFNDAEYAAIIERCVDWQASLEMGTPPPLDESLSTYETVRGRHPDIDPDGEVQISAEDAVELLDAIHAESEAEIAARAAKIHAAELMGSAKYLKCGDVKIADRRTKNGGKPFVTFNKKADLSA